MKYIGAHISIAGGVQNAPLRARALGAGGFGMFTKNQRQWQTKPYSERDIAEFKANMKAGGYAKKTVVPHVGYLLNLGHPEEEKRQKSIEALLDEMRRVKDLDLLYLNLHPGATLGKISPAKCVSRVAESINQALASVEEVILLLETTAGQGTSIGRDFGELAEIIERVKPQSRIGVCLDTCHVFAAGYDIRTRQGYQSTISEFDQKIGLSYLKAWHLNDAKSEFASRVDRHHSLGRGHIGLEPFGWIMRDQRLEGLSFVLETIDYSIWKQEIALLYQFYQNR